MLRRQRGLIVGMLLLVPALWFGSVSVRSGRSSLQSSSVSSVARLKGRAALPGPAGPGTAVSQPRREPAGLASVSSGQPSPALSTPARTLSGEGPEASSLLPWENRATCPAQANGQWLRYLRGFRAVPSHAVQLFVAPSLDPQLEPKLVKTLKGAALRVKASLGLSASDPVFYVHPSLEALREHSCLAENGVAFYDGAIHLAGPAVDAETYKTVLHEYTHHVLFWNGIREPMWFQEGLAMHVAGERWADYDISPPGLAIAEMVDTLPRETTPLYLERFYGQSYLMLEFVMTLCRGQSFCNERGFIAKLREGGPPGGLFEALIQQAAPRATQPALALWQMYFMGLRREPQ